LKSHPLAWTSLAPALTGGRGVGGVALTSQEAAAWLSLLPLIPPKSPSPLLGGGGEMNGNSGAAAGSRSLVCRSCRNYGFNVLSKLVTALVTLERWRGF
jgi:hypothetical protein